MTATLPTGVAIATAVIVVWGSPLDMCVPCSFAFCTVAVDSDVGPISLAMVAVLRVVGRSVLGELSSEVVSVMDDDASVGVVASCGVSVLVDEIMDEIDSRRDVVEEGVGTTILDELDDGATADVVLTVVLDVELGVPTAVDVVDPFVASPEELVWAGGFDVVVP